MVTSTNQKPRPMSAVDPILERDGVRNEPSNVRIENGIKNKGGNTFAFVALALIVLFGGYMFYSYSTSGNSVSSTTNKTDVVPPAAAPVPPAATDALPKVDTPAATGATTPPAATETIKPVAPSAAPAAPATTTP